MTEWILYFAAMGFLGWVYETFVMTIWEGKWDNRGFLFGPVLPIYALGGIGVKIVFGFLMPQYTILQVFFIGMVGSAVLEFTVSYVLEKIFHQTWWDYSLCPFNLQGRICPPASIGFGIAALVVVYFINPKLFGILDRVPSKVAVFLSGLYALVFMLDLMLTVYNLKIGDWKYPGYNRLNNKMETFVENHRLTERSISEYFHEKAGK